MGAFEKLLNPDFTNLDDLHVVLNDNDIVLAHGVYDSNQPNPGPHVAVSSVNSTMMYDFIKIDADTYTLKVRQLRP
jgi:hypothetical protein